jgi:hypothetical protein
MKNRTWTILSIAAVCLVLAGLAIVMLRTPPVPAEWQRVRPGMKRETVLKLVAEPPGDLRDLKGFDMYIRRYRLLIRPCYWEMLVHYNERDEAVEVRLLFTDPNCGLFNKNLRVEKAE